MFDEIPHSEEVLKRHQNSDDPCIMAWDHYTMSPKERVKDFNQRFTTILNKFQAVAKPTQELQIEVYANMLPASISMFVKRAAKKTLAENFEEAKTIEFQMKGCKEGQDSLVKRETQPPPRGVSF